MLAGFILILLRKSMVKAMKKRIGLYLWLAGINCFISSFTFGGGYVVVPMVRKYFVERRGLFSEEELLEMAAVSQSAPGAIAVNLIALAGYRVAGKSGLVVSCTSALIPPLIILSVVSVFYNAIISNAAVGAVLRGMQAGAAALIVDFVADMTGNIFKQRSLLLDMLVIITFLLSFFTGINVAIILCASCLLCSMRVFFRRGKD